MRAWLGSLLLVSCGCGTSSSPVLASDGGDDSRDARGTEHAPEVDAAATALPCSGTPLFCDDFERPNGYPNGWLLGDAGSPSVAKEQGDATSGASLLRVRASAGQAGVLVGPETPFGAHGGSGEIAELVVSCAIKLEKVSFARVLELIDPATGLARATVRVDASKGFFGLEGIGFALPALGTWHRLRLEVADRGNGTTDLRLFVDGQAQRGTMIGFFDARAPLRVLVGVAASDSSEQDVSFDDLRID